ncbi:MAG: UDP-N-acetylglucosamine 1-carboxyvinyltransferase [Limnochordia bacterium]|jgi:UDP-N-acetylglucosamine 1-carboxyvinyltransferase|nr:UDP-N-acetylglucosamine 1-carboxyvinyltransferase [Limnochordia bacterium]MDI9464553.1 UDP-N-acetylglucosamine 1-carboxyvinyltransferase [Bacillota bacterium]NLO95975.1 UDP-N-acetylglucosamine 1-carboxyvinyltransferase [Bacillota bacterium]HAN95004.1 UDP-N-acetylglucosamine 1-carboxyvinyltransferase [Bacillota bacterium]HOB39628.1 UDP-N-acetylglucosamine 1-carboxyvinyltransferase [Limnochordia bacterium]
MSVLIIEGGRPLRGSVDISGAKNSALAIVVAAALATEGECVLDNIPQGSDVNTICQILQDLGVEVWYDDQRRLHVRGETLSKHKASYELVRRMRASFYSAGLLLARLGKAEVPLPGGCAIGSRPVDFHIKGFAQLGAEVVIEHGYMKAEATRLKGAHIYINRSSVGTTINLMIAASLAEGTTVLENAAKEPEVVDLAIFLNGMGAKIRGAGTESIRIEGVEKLRGIEYSIIPDRIEAGTFMLATAITGGDVVLRNVVAEHLRVPIVKMEEAGVRVTRSGTELRVVAPRRLKAVDVETLPYPGFPTDLQQPFVAAMCLADGTSVVRETIFDRFRYVDELRRMGADIKTEQNTAIVRGVPQLTGAPVEVTDLRAGAALAIAALAAQGRTELYGAEIIDRGYEFFEEKLRSLGANIYREQLTNPRELVIK